MLNNFKEKISKDLLMSKNRIKEAYSELLRKGFLFTENFNDDSIDLINLRLLYSAPANGLADNQITIGPFPLKLKDYKYIKNIASKDGQQSVLLAFKKLQYEKTGNTEGEYQFIGDDESIAFISGLIEDFFEINNPYHASDIVWFYPKSSYKEKIISTFLPNQELIDDLQWWNIAIELSGDCNFNTKPKSEEDYILIPNEIIGEWYRYLPRYLPMIITKLYCKKSKGMNFQQFKDKLEIIEIIDNEIKNKIDDIGCPDRELIIKELLNFNKLEYPIDSEAICDLLIKIGIIDVKYEGIRVNYFISNGESIKLPSEVLTIPKNWDDKLDHYLNTGSILLSYLNIDEII